MTPEPKTILSIKDPLYGYAELTELEKRVIHTRIFQRLRFITQNGLAFYTYPSIRGSRFEHCIGACHLVGRVMNSLVEHSEKGVLTKFLRLFLVELETLLNPTVSKRLKESLGIKKTSVLRLSAVALENLAGFMTQLVRLLALLHDIGHLPFSHLGEEAVKPYTKKILSKKDCLEYENVRSKSNVKLHEFLGYKLITENCGGISEAFAEPADDLHLQAIKGIYRAKLKKCWATQRVISKLYELVSSDIDVDRGDYLRRDGYSSGTGFGNYDIDRLVESIRLEEVQREGGKPDFLIAPSDASISPVETFLVERYNLHKWLYYHHSIRYFNYCLVKSLDSIIQLRDQLLRLKEKFKLSYFDYTRYVYRDGFISNEIWLWDVFYLAYIDLHKKRHPSPKVKQALVYLDVIRWRRKLGFSVWKTHPEYLAFNSELKKKICQEEQSDSLGTTHFKLGDSNLNEVSERLFFNTILSHIRTNKLLEEEFLDKFSNLGIPICYDDIRNDFPNLNLKGSFKVGTAFIILNDFKPFEKSSISTPNQVVSQFEFLLRKRRDGKKVIRLTDVSRLAASLYEAWQSDIQSYLYFILSSTELENIVTKEKRSPLAKIVLYRFCELVSKWLIDEKKLVEVGA